MDDNKKKIILYAGAGLAFVIIVVIIVTLLSGGGNKNQKNNQLNPNQKITLNFWDPIDSPADFKDIIANYESLDENKNIKINYVNKPIADYETESVKAIAAGDGPNIWAIPNDSILSNQESLSSAPSNLFKVSDKDNTSITKYIKDNFYPIVADENIIDNKLYGVPLFVDTLALYSNASLLGQRRNDLRRANINFSEQLFDNGPQSWNDLIELVKEYTVTNNGEIQKSALALGRSDNVEHSADILALLMMQNGAKMASPDGLTATFNLPSSTKTDSNYYPGTEALKFLTSFSDPNSSNYTWNDTFPNSYAAFRDGQTAMMIDYANRAQDLKQENPNLNFKIWPLPQIKGESHAVDFASYWTLTVPKSGIEITDSKTCINNPSQLPCQKEVAAWNFIKYLQGTAITTYAANSGLPISLINKNNPGPASALNRLTGGYPFNFQPATAMSWYRAEDPTKIEGDFEAMIAQVNNQHIDPQSAINSAAQDVSTIFRKRAGFSTQSNTTPQKADQ